MSSSAFLEQVPQRKEEHRASSRSCFANCLHCIWNGSKGKITGSPNWPECVKCITQQQMAQHCVSEISVQYHLRDVFTNHAAYGKDLLCRDWETGGGPNLPKHLFMGAFFPPQLVFLSTRFVGIRSVLCLKISQKYLLFSSSSHFPPPHTFCFTLFWETLEMEVAARLLELTLQQFLAYIYFPFLLSLCI